MPEPPLEYKVLMWARDMGISYLEALRTPNWVVHLYLEMRDLENEYGPKRDIM